MEKNDHLLIGFGVAIGATLGLLSGIMLAGWLHAVGFDTTVWAAAWSGVTGLLGAAAGGGLAVYGAIRAAKHTAQTMKDEADRKDRVDFFQAHFTMLISHIEEVEDVQTLIEPLAAEIQHAFALAKDLGDPPKLDGSHSAECLGTLQNLRQEFTEIALSQTPSLPATAKDLRSEWLYLRVVARRFLIPISEFLDDKNKSSPEHELWRVAKTLLPTIDKRREMVSAACKTRIEALHKNVDETKKTLLELRFGEVLTSQVLALGKGHSNPAEH